MDELKTVRQLIEHCNKTEPIDCGKDCSEQCNRFFKRYHTIPCKEDGLSRETTAWIDNLDIEEL
uniref:Uncharacterized protein n=1 Tax=Dulem virus 36 TaxID=3145754 RepID=A0AAU8B1Y3_9CAUD